MIRLGIPGCHGRMGKALIQTALNDPQFKITAGTVTGNNPLQDTASLPFKPQDHLSKIMEDFDTLIDFTSPEATLIHLPLCQKWGKKIVIGTTGFNAEQKAFIQEMSQHIPIVFSPNMSIGINLCFELIKQAAAVLKDSADIEIIEAHHRHKIDAPSGTALQMAEIISSVRDKETIGFSSIRAGDIVGEHSVLFALAGERIEITHKSSNRNIFANGALLAAKWLETRTQGLYTMADVLLAKR